MKWHGWGAVCAQHWHGVHQAETRRQQRGYMVDSRQLVIHGNAEDSNTAAAIQWAFSWKEPSLLAKLVYTEDDLSGTMITYIGIV